MDVATIVIVVRESENFTLVHFLWQEDLVSVAHSIADCLQYSKLIVVHVNSP